MLWLAAIKMLWLFCVTSVYGQQQYESIYSNGLDYSGLQPQGPSYPSYSPNPASGYESYQSQVNYGQQPQVTPSPLPTDYSQYQTQLQQQAQQYPYQPAYPSPYAQQNSYPTQQSAYTPAPQPQVAVDQNNVQRYAQYLNLLEKNYGIQIPGQQVPNQQVAPSLPYTRQEIPVKVQIPARVTQPEQVPQVQPYQPMPGNAYHQQPSYPSYPAQQPAPPPQSQPQPQPQIRVQPETVKSPYSYQNVVNEVRSPYTTYIKPAQTQYPPSPYTFPNPSQKVQHTVVSYPTISSMSAPSPAPAPAPAPAPMPVPVPSPQTYMPQTQHQIPSLPQTYVSSQETGNSQGPFGQGTFPGSESPRNNQLQQGGFPQGYPYPQQKIETPDVDYNSVVEIPKSLPPAPMPEQPTPVQPSPPPTNANSLSGERPTSVASATSVQALTQQIRRLPAVLYVDSRDPQAKNTETLLRETYGLPLVAFYVDKIDDPKAVQKNLKHLTAHDGLPYLFICGTFIGSQQHIENYHSNKQIPQLVEYVCGDDKKSS
ncbi:hypothetical protein L596_010915 [Steinernema carpocapsae]|nr:hypothetical protein L596_010915 [Steinernema carpocapsae]